MSFNGLSDKQAAESREKHGSNKLSAVKGESFLQKLFFCFSDPMIKILIVALLINIIILLLDKLDIVNSDIKWYEPLGIAFAVCISVIVSAFSEYRNETAFRMLQDEASKIKCKVYRNGENITELSIDDIVTGDLILLQSGDKIPADGVIVSGDIMVDQSALNGEPYEAKKTVMPSDHKTDDAPADTLSPYHVFRGAIVCSGNAVIKAVFVGDKTEYGKIAVELQQSDDRDSPLKVKLSKLAGGISRFGYAGGIAIAVVFMLSRILTAGFTDYYSGNFGTYFIKDILDAVILAVIIIVMAVPEGLPLMIAIVSAQNMGKMLKDNVLVRKISGIETAGSVNILFSDKTGTITKGRLKAVAFLDGYGVCYSKCSAIGGNLEMLLVMAASENTDSIINGDKIIGGNATERAILEFVKESIKKDKGKLEKKSVLSFNSENKYSASTVSYGGTDLTLIKGAPEKILDKCSYFFDVNGKKKPIDENWIIEKKINDLSKRAIRVVAIAISDTALKNDELPNGEWTLVGIIGIRDEIRPESVTAVAEVQKAGIQTVMITGDRKDTAAAIASESGLIDCEDAVILTSDELNNMTDDEIKKILPKIRVIARALPTDKSRLVRLAQELGLVAGMTGDGVNDSPALKKADVGFAMGSGTEVAKEASDIVVLDDNFNSIDKAVLYGRTIFNSIRKFIIFQLTINIAAVAVSFICPLLGMSSPLSVTQILWVNLVMDSLAALAFGGEPALKRYMHEKPKSREESIISKYMYSEILTGAVWTVIISLLFLTFTPIQGIFLNNDSVYYGNYIESLNTQDIMLFKIPSVNNVQDNADLFKYLYTGYFTLFILVSVFNAFNARTKKFNPLDSIKGNAGFLKVFGLIILIQVIMTYLGGAVMNCYGLTIKQWLVIIVIALSIIPIDIIRKLIINRINNKQKME